MYDYEDLYVLYYKRQYFISTTLKSEYLNIIYRDILVLKIQLHGVLKIWEQNFVSIQMFINIIVNTLRQICEMLIWLNFVMFGQLKVRLN